MPRGRGVRGNQRNQTVVQENVHHVESEQDPAELYEFEGHGMNRPDGQLNLTDFELNEEMPIRMLTANNPQAAQNITLFSFKDHQYRITDLVDQTTTHLAVDSKIVLKDSDEARDQDAYHDDRRIEIERLTQNAGDNDMKKSVRNQFNFSERTAQTFNNSIRNRSLQTEPPIMKDNHNTVTQWEIWDVYMEELENSRRASEEQKGKDKDKKKRQEDALYSSSMKHSLKIMERMIIQNAMEEEFYDYKYYEHKIDEARPDEGSLLPLWRFSSEKSKRKQVTSICWNPKYKDLFAISYGSYDFLKQSTGLICCYSLKNVMHPEYAFTTESGVMCLDFHPSHPALLCVGVYDGTVLVYDIRIKHNRPIYQSTVRTMKHTDPVWQVSWQREDLTKNINFFSISSDGRVTNWILMKNKLEPEEVMKLKLVNSQKDAELEEEASLSGLAGGMCFDFHPSAEHMFIVGTEEGKIYKCSKAYSGQYLEVYDGHFMAVYSVKWNSFHEKIFISCSADWTIKLWDHTQKSAIMSFDLGCAVGDVAWSPYSSTVFSAVTSDGYLHVYDLAHEKHRHLANQQVVKRAKLTHVAFNPLEPIILVGDDRGGVNCSKLSPNLRRTAKIPEDKEDTWTQRDAEVDKMNRILKNIDRDNY